MFAMSVGLFTMTSGQTFLFHKWTDMPFSVRIHRGLIFLLAGVLSAERQHCTADEGIEFFERKIRPVLADRCYVCHSSAAAGKNTLKGGLRLDTRDGVRKGGDSGPAVVPGRPNDSLLLDAIRHESLEMPPREKLPRNVIADFEKWIRMGAPDPRSGALPQRENRTSREKWVFQSPQAPTLEIHVDENLSPIDLLVMSRGPERPADRRTLIRRASYDLLGLPPTPEEIEEFLADDEADAFTRVVDRMLASPDFGIRWGRHWLDNVRYAQDDPTCNANSNGTFSIAPYRDWVVKSFNRDLPYDQFVRLQVAGDLIPMNDPEQINTDGLTATGIWGLAHLVEGNDREKVVADFVDEQLDVLGRTFLGLTVSCARCHDHKFDPIQQADYYGLAGIFYSSHIFTFDGKGARIRRRVQQRAVTTRAEQQEIKPAEEELARLAAGISPLEDRFEKQIELMSIRRELMEQRSRASESVGERTAVARRIKELSDREVRLLEDQKKKGWNENPPELQQLEELQEKRDAVRKKLSRFPLRLVMQEGPVPDTRHAEAGDMPLFQRGDHHSPGDLVPRTVPRVFLGRKETFAVTGSGRLQLADWLTKPDHPLTSRVMANRVWQQLFGRGIVSTPGNFGQLGQVPSNPKLLDYLAIRLVDGGWSIKSLIREIMTSRAYQRSSLGNPEQRERDPENLQFGRMNRKRLDAESLMDTLAWHRGDVQRTPIDSPEWKLAVSGRSLFGEFSRDKPSTALELFDGASPDLIVPARPDSTSAPQALFMLNNDAVLKAAAALADRAFSSSEDASERIEYLYVQLYGRPPTEEEQELGKDIVRSASVARQTLQETKDTDVGPVADPAKGAWVDLCVSLICSNEFLYVD